MGDGSVVIDKMVMDVFMDVPANHEVSTNLLNKTAEDVKTGVLPNVEKQLIESGINYSDVDIKIDRLDIDISNIDQSSWKEAVASEIVAHIIEAKKQEDERNTNSVSSSLKNYSLLDLWEFYLSYGRFPSWKKESISLVDVVNQTIAEESASLYHEIKPILLKNKQAFLRFLLIPSTVFSFQGDDHWFDFLTSLPKSRFFDDFKFTLRHKALGNNHDFHSTELKFIHEGVKELYKYHASFVNSNTDIIQELDQYLVGKKVQSDSQMLNDRLELIEDQQLAEFIRMILSQSGANSDQASYINDYIVSTDQTNYNWSSFLLYFSNMLNSRKSIDTLSKVLHEFERKNNVDANLLKTLKDTIALSSVEDDIEVQEKEHLPIDESIEVANAGIVLLKPFIPQLFVNLGLLDDKNQWKNLTTQEEAMYILNYLSTGNFECTEDQLFLMKLLVDWNEEEHVRVPDTLLGTQLNIYEDQIPKLLEQELTDLLTVIQSNWKPMRNCSWNGLRNDFLSREGMIKRVDDNRYQLSVNEGGRDVMLPFKKWGIGIIKYSWMQNILTVEWE